ncbi:hypothetical protein RhoFasGS6_05059 [Rhodococcus fascians]|nr:hypothetical protein [Rhodococcus fascians]
MTDRSTSSTDNSARSNSSVHAHAIVERALAVYGFAGHDLTLVKYRENHVFRLRRAAGDLAVRLHRASYNTNDAIAAELDLLLALAGAGFDVPAVVPTVDGDLYTTVVDDGVERTVSVLRWVNDAAAMGYIESAFAGTSTMTSEQFHRVGALAGELHNHLSTRDASGGASRPSWDFEGLVGRDAVWGDPLALAELDPVRPLIADALNTLSRHPVGGRKDMRELLAHSRRIHTRKRAGGRRASSVDRLRRCRTRMACVRDRDTMVLVSTAPSVRAVRRGRTRQLRLDPRPRRPHAPLGHDPRSRIDLPRLGRRQAW